MKRSLLCLLTLVALIGMSVGHARDTRLRISIEEAMTTPDAESKLNAGIRFFFGDQEHPEIERQLGTYTSNKKTNAFGKSDQKACKWAILSAMITFQERAITEGGNDERLQWAIHPWPIRMASSSPRIKRLVHALGLEPA